MAHGLLFGLLAALAWGSTDVCAAVASRRVGGVTTGALVQTSSLAGLVAVALLGGGPLDLAASALPLAVLMGLVSAVSYLTFYVALRLGPIAVVSPVGSAYGAVAVVLSVLVLGERLTAAQALGCVVATSGVVLVSLQFGRSVRMTRISGPGVPFVVVAMLCWGLMTVGVASLVRDNALVPVLLAMRVTTAVAIWSIVLARRVTGDRFRGAPTPAADPEAAEGGSTPWGARPIGEGTAMVLALGAGLLDMAGSVAYGNGLRESAAWLVGLSSSFGPAVAFIFAVIALGDRLRPLQWLGLAGLGGGLLLVGLP